MVSAPPKEGRRKTRRQAELPWDHFLKEEAENKAEYKAAFDRMTEWHQLYWKDILHHLRQDNGWDVPEGLMPHWVGPGEARYWQRNTVEKGGEVVEERWEPTSPLPASNASQIDHYLSKGLLLRPPEKGRSVERLTTAEPLAGASEQEAVIEHPYKCVRHGRDRLYGFPVWGGYIQHCVRYNEEIEYSLPKDVQEGMSQYKWYCRYHNVGFKEYQRKAAAHHARRPHVYGAQTISLNGFEVIATGE